MLRIEDTDAARSSAEHEGALQDDLRWLGLGWDEGAGEGGADGPYRQSERLTLYRDKTDALVEGGLAYPCFCSQQLLEEERAAQREAGRASIYPGRCRRIPRQEAARRRATEGAAVRFDVQATAGGDPSIGFTDLVHGEVRFPVSQLGDFVILRRDGWPSYNFAVVVDDIQMRITHVIRGDDHLSNTPRQIIVYRALAARALPHFAHLPLIAGPGGAPLSKREGSASVAWFRAQGYPPEALMNYLALLGWSPPAGQDLLTQEELISQFDLDRVSRAPAIFDRQKLDALAARHMIRMPAGRLASLAAEHLRRAGLLGPGAAPGTSDWVGRLAMLYADRLPRMSDLPAASAFLFDFSPERSLADPEVRVALADPRARGVIEAMTRRLGAEPLTAARFQALAEETRRETGAKGRDLYHPLRIALTGASSGPEMVKLLPVIEEGSRLPLPKRVPACAERARSLLDATRKASG
ncbi:MAG: glutamate--tRNA ligase [Acidobacteria bacterium]|nr:MAG: glutamate--tRNA ligase [Acidobacteriota bacterium]